MYAVIQTGGKQYRVKPGDLLVVEKLDGQPGDELRFDQILMMGEGDQITVGAPTVSGGLVKAVLIETRKGEKIKVFKKIRRQGYRRTRGHRQLQSVLRVTGITANGSETKWDGEVKLTTKAELNARSRNLPFQAPAAAAAPAAEAAPARPEDHREQEADRPDDDENHADHVDVEPVVAHVDRQPEDQSDRDEKEADAYAHTFLLGVHVPIFLRHSGGNPGSLFRALRGIPCPTPVVPGRYGALAVWAARSRRARFWRSFQARSGCSSTYGRNSQGVRK